MTRQPLRIHLLAFDGLTQLDLTGPYEVLSKVANATVSVVARDAGVVVADGGFRFLAHESFEAAGMPDVLVVPGGPGVDDAISAEDVLDHIRAAAASALFVVSVCTGALLLGAAGILRGRTAATHWAAREHLARFGAVVSTARVVRDGNVMTGGGVTAGIDIALALVAEIAGEEAAGEIRLLLEYDPGPSDGSGSPETARRRTVDAVLESLLERRPARLAAVDRATRGLDR